MVPLTRRQASAAPPMPSDRGDPTLMQLPQPSAFPELGDGQEIPSYLWQSLVAMGISCFEMIFMCLPLGLPFAIVALVYASKVERLNLQGEV